MTPYIKSSDLECPSCQTKGFVVAIQAEKTVYECTKCYFVWPDYGSTQKLIEETWITITQG